MNDVLEPVYTVGFFENQAGISTVMKSSSGIATVTCTSTGAGKCTLTAYLTRKSYDVSKQASQ